MIIEIAPELVLSALQEGHEMHVKVLGGITAENYRVVSVAMNQRGNIEIGLQHKSDAVFVECLFAPAFQWLDCGQ